MTLKTSDTLLFVSVDYWHSIYTLLFFVYFRSTKHVCVLLLLLICCCGSHRSSTHNKISAAITTVIIILQRAKVIAKQNSSSSYWKFKTRQSHLGSSSTSSKCMVSIWSNGKHVRTTPRNLITIYIVFDDNLRRRWRTNQFWCLDSELKGICARTREHLHV